MLIMPRAGSTVHPTLSTMTLLRQTSCVKVDKCRYTWDGEQPTSMQHAVPLGNASRKTLHLEKLFKVSP